MSLNINLVSFLDPFVYGGGGEMISRALMEYGILKGHQIKLSSVRPRKVDFFEKPDLTIFIDVFNIGHTYKSLGGWRSFPKKFIEEMMRKSPFVHMTNAYTDVCNLPYLPCSGDGLSECKVKLEIGLTKKIQIRDLSNQCFAKQKLPLSLYEKSNLNIYLSPLHQRICERLLGNTNLPESYIVRPMIDTKRFYNMNMKRDIDYLFMGIVGEAKGLKEIREKYKDKNIWLIGKKSPETVVDFGTYLNHVPYEDVPKYMNRAKHFVFLPRWPEPQGRVISEAALCGCEIIGNDNVGALSFDHDLSNAENYHDVEADFWQRIERVVA